VTRPDREGEKGLIGRIASGASERVLDIVDPNLVLDHVDVDALLEKVDVNRLLERVDVNQLLDRVDVNALMDRVDVDALMERVDVRDLVDRAGIPDIVAESTGHLTGSALDLLRKPIVGLDEIIFRSLNRMIGRDPTSYPAGPGELVSWVDGQSRGTPAAIKTGRYAGPLTRLLAVLVDSFVVTFGFTLIVAGIVFFIRLFSPDFTVPANPGLLYGVSLVAWAFFYLWFSLAVFGKTIGKMLLGVRVVSSDGEIVLKGGKPLVRVLTYPLSFAVLGIGLIGVVFNPERQAWHDRLAKTAVVYDWGSRTASMPTPLADFLQRRGAGG
jgi:uncharacterized RDD family membrane protein YckC